MNKNTLSRNGLIHLYNPKEEGLGSYDVHYINAYKKKEKKRLQQVKSKRERPAA